MLKKLDVVVPPVEMVITPPEGSPVPPPVRTLLSSRASSIFPAGDFRNGDSGSVLDIKTDVMVNWLHQQQMQRQWSLELPGEGVILKKARESFACSPAHLREESNGFYENVVAMNVRVSPDSPSCFDVADFEKVCHDCSYTNAPNFPYKTGCQPRPAGKWSPTSDITNS